MHELLGLEDPGFAKLMSWNKTGKQITKRPSKNSPLREQIVLWEGCPQQGDNYNCGVFSMIGYLIVCWDNYWEPLVHLLDGKVKERPMLGVGPLREMRKFSLSSFMEHHRLETYRISKPHPAPIRFTSPDVPAGPTGSSSPPYIPEDSVGGEVVEIGKDHEVVRLGMTEQTAILVKDMKALGEALEALQPHAESSRDLDNAWCEYAQQEADTSAAEA
ncbi:hypothetical protein HK104_011506 [Borealophlyctis nickersoniae]|nr:hypothetical protein HK104_011506 [Borealophlyctis nickersoniae]